MDAAGKGKFTKCKSSLQNVNLFGKMHKAVTITKHYTTYNKNIMKRKVYYNDTLSGALQSGKGNEPH